MHCSCIIFGHFFAISSTLSILFCCWNTNCVISCVVFEAVGSEILLHCVCTCARVSGQRVGIEQYDAKISIQPALLLVILRYAICLLHGIATTTMTSSRRHYAKSYISCIFQTWDWYVGGFGIWFLSLMINVEHWWLLVSHKGNIFVIFTTVSVEW